MKAATISEIKHELTQTNPSILIDLCLKLAKFKKDNKDVDLSNITTIILIQPLRFQKSKIFRIK
jgi:hypothetical protein